MTELVSVQAETYWEHSPWLIDQLADRNKRKKNILGCSTGSLGIGKTYWFLALCERMDADFKIDSVVFNPKEFWYAVDLYPRSEWHWILWDDPTRGLAKRDWYKELNKTVTSFIQTSSRYKGKNLGFALPGFDLLDLNVKQVMVFEAMMKNAGLARVHRIKKNKFGSPPFWKPYMGEGQFKIPTLAEAYEKKREKFTATTYTEKEFDDETALTVFERVLKEVKADYARFLHPTTGKLYAAKISALCRCSDQLARKVKLALEDEYELTRKVETKIEEGY